jgi:Na+/H+-dicarboxylate symporter
MSRTLNLWIAVGLGLGLLVGLGAAAGGPDWLRALAEASAPLGRLFINAVRMVVIPLVVALVFSSVTRAGGTGRLGDTAKVAAASYLGLLLPAIALGMGMTALGMQFAPDAVAPQTEGPSVPELPGLADFLVSLVPANPFAAAADGALLPLIVFTLLFGLAAATLSPDRRARMVDGAKDISDALIKLVTWVLWLAPIGVFGLIAPATARLGWDLVASLGLFIVCVIAALLLFAVLVYVPVIAVLGRTGPVRFFGGTGGAASVAFATTSTATAIPVSLEESVNKLGVPRDVAELLIPFGASLFRPGSALFQGAAIVFLAHLYGVELGLGGYAGAFFATLIVSLTVAPVPSAGVMTLAPALATLSIPSAGLGLLLGIDRIPDMFRSAVNVWGQIAVAVLAGRKGLDAPAPGAVDQNTL